MLKEMSRERETDRLGLAIEKLRKEHCPIHNAGAETCFTCPILLMVEARGGSLSDLCCNCQKKGLESRKALSINPA